MTCARTDAIQRRLLAGAPLGPDDVRHLATCAACSRAAAGVEQLDARLREAARPLALEPIPDEALAELSIGADIARPASVIGLGVMMAGAAAVLVGSIALSLGVLPMALGPSLSVAPSSPPADTPGPVASPRPSADASASPAFQPTIPVAAHLVAPLATCSDGTAGFSVVLPDDWYANRGWRDQPACRTVGPIREVDSEQILDPVIYLGVSDEEPVFESTSIEERVELTSASGVSVSRFTVRTPESGALASVYEVVHVARLLDGRWLAASTDATNAQWVTGLDELMERLDVREPIAVDPAAMETAVELFADRDVCEDPARGLAVVFPDAWWTNTAVDDLPACSWFAPTSFVYESRDRVPDAVAILLNILERPPATPAELVAWDTITLLGHPATRWLTDGGGTQTYQYVVQLGPTADSGPTLVIETTADIDNVAVAMAVLDELAPRVTMADPPPGASSANPDINAPPAVAEAGDGDFTLELAVEQDRYRAGQPILAAATLTYAGPEPSVRVWGSGTGIVITSLRQLDGPIDPGAGATTDCMAYELAAGVPLQLPFSKSGGFAGDDPLVSFYEAYFSDPLLRLPAGRWEIVANASGTIGGADCGAGGDLGLRASVEIVVEP